MKIRKGKFKTNERDYNYGEPFESYVYSKEVSNDVKSSLIEGEKLSNRFRNRGLTRDKRATVNTVLDNRTLLILKKLKDNLLNEIYGVVSSGKEAYVFNSHKYLSEEELRGVKELLLRRRHRGCDDQHSDDQHSDDQHSDDQHSDDQHSDDQHSDYQHSDHQHSDHQHSDHQHSDHQHSDHQHSDHQHSDHQHSDHQPSDYQHSDDHHSDVQRNDDQHDAGLPDGDGARRCVRFAQESLYKVYHLTRHLDEVGAEKREEAEDAKNAKDAEDLKHAEEDEAGGKNAANQEGRPNLRGGLDETYDIIDQMSEMTAEVDEQDWNPFQNKKKKVAISFATKVYNTSVLVFKKRSQYIEGEFRFRNAYTKNTNPRKMVKQWSEKEFRNLRRILICGLRCPYPLVLKSNVIVMSMLGSLDTACPKMKDLNLSPLKWKELYIECICILRQLFCNCKLVHADFSEYNLLYFYNHIYIIDVSQSMEHDHPYSLEFLKRDCVNVTNFFKKRIGTLQNDMQESLGQLNGMLQGAKINQEVALRSRCGVRGEDASSDITNGANYTNCENGPPQDKGKNSRDTKSSEPFYSHVQILPLKKLFDYIVSSSLPQDVTYFLERDKKEIHIDPSEITYLEIFGLIKNTTPIPKLNLRNIKKNRTYFEKLKRATGYYVTKFSAQNQPHIKKHADRSQVEEQIFLSSWIPSHLNEIKDIRTIEKDLKLLKKGKSMVSNFISTNHHTERSKHAPKNNTFLEHNSLEGENHSDAATGAKNRRTNGDCTVHAQKEDSNDEDNGEGDPYEQGKETPQDGEQEVLDELSDKGPPKSLEKEATSKNLLDAHKSDTANDENNFVNSEQEEEVKFRGIIPEGVTRKEWSKLVKEQNREKRKHKIPKYQKKKKKNKAHLKKK
ncbi:Atypical/RIO/RIO1 protein kinase [Plasmodium inui San Antonio 1]|uniref:non-specific serine/threonine protein kinase n=1 Tax=Plasmodium inui San Antonio 1 TaxID=1237626 RepID=W7A2Z3_9APIC|nr:Atypical/RIO/RIO1 protein kinase [Plasmodium inui San Antonio 1]EUD66025.1 Atypical/RIO/RIO1 protein kinase [Plasmodium inui San Antonio 1]